MLALARLYEGSLQPDAVITYLENDKVFTSALCLNLKTCGVAIIAEAARLASQPEIRTRMLENLLAADVGVDSHATSDNLGGIAKSIQRSRDDSR